MITCGCIFDVRGKQEELKKIEETLSDPSFWSRPDDSQKILRKRKQLEEILEKAQNYRTSIENLQKFIESCRGEEEEAVQAVLADIDSEIEDLERQVSSSEVKTLLSRPHDANNAIVTIHPGAGGTESQDWAEMLLRMYLRWAEKHSYKTQITDYQVGEEAGIKSVTFLVEGELACGLLSAEIGVHRLVRISPFDAAARRHTSFASLFVTPELEEDVDHSSG